MVGYIFDATKGETPRTLAEKRAIAKALLGAQRAPQNVGEGISALGDGIVARVLNERADAAEQSGMASAQDAFGPILAALGGGGGGAFPSAPAAPREPAVSTMDPLQTEAATGEIPSDMQKYRDGIASIESGGRYDIIGPTHPKLGRALGKYQVMEANVGPWSEKHLGRKISADEFLANPKLQDAIFDGEFGGYLKKFGPEGAAQAWFGGEGGVGKVDRKDVLGTSIGGYGKRFVDAIGGASQPAPVQVASLDPSSGMGGVDPYSRIPATDSRGEDQRAKFREWNSNPIANEGANLAGVDPAMRKVIERAKQIAGTDFVLGSGQRDPAMQKKAMEWGWSKTEDSDHLGGGAADLWPVDANGAVNFDPQAQAKIVTAMKQAAQELGVDMEAGADWKSFKDMPHFGMVGQTPMSGPIPPMRDGSQPQVASADPVVPMPTPGEPAPAKRIAQALTGSQTDAMPEMAGNAPMGQGGLSIPQLLAAGSNPFMPEGNQKIIDLLMQEEMKKRDPAYGMGLDKQRIELEALRNPRMSPYEQEQTRLKQAELDAQQKKLMELAGGNTVFDPVTRQPVFTAPKEVSAPTVQTFYGPDGREYKAQWNQQTNQWDQVGGSKAAGKGITVTSPDGTTMQLGGDLTEGQSKDTVYATRAEGALPLIDKFGDALTSLPETVGGQLPIVGNYAKSPEFQQAEQAGLEFLQAILRKDTGAAIAKEETQQYGTVYLPRPGDSPELLEQKKASRARALEAIKAGMPPQALLYMEQALAKERGAGKKEPVVIDGYKIEEVP